ncbi:MAG: hypothetical protein Q7J35_13670 [Candidatus Methanoperedens sp.]|nr:hypothetical protein [Candidatus Methanoperedens sp.]
MSGESLVVGSLIFNDGTPEKTKLQVLEELAGAIEVEVSDLRFDIYSGKWSFQSINWQSHVKGDRDTYLHGKPEERNKTTQLQPASPYRSRGDKLP